MKVYLSPQRSNNKLEYVFDGHHVEVTYNENLKEAFDLTDVYEEAEDGGKRRKPQEILPVNPIISAEEIDGELHVSVLRYHGTNPPHDVAWPDWIEVEDGATYPHPDE